MVIDLSTMLFRNLVQNKRYLVLIQFALLFHNQNSNLTSYEKFKKVYDITVPDTLNFQIMNGLNCFDTSETGYIQRRLVKAMVDCKVYYDQTVRNATGALVQFLYGEDGIEGTKIEKQ
jgi:hypothetical protein